jgi:hypothetical protein
MNKLTQRRIEGLRGELFHMILFAMAWVLIGEYSVDFRDDALAAILVLVMVIWLAIYSIKLYELEDSLPEESRIHPSAIDKVRGNKRAWLFALVFFLEGVAILATWMMLLKWQREYWLIPCFALIAGLHFLPLARVIGHHSYYILGIWICVIAVAGYMLLYHSIVDYQTANTLIAYGCAAGAIIDGMVVMIRTQKLKRLTH